MIVNTLGALVPIDLTTAMLTSSTAAEADYEVWNKDKAYAKDAFCISIVTHRIYQCMAANTGRDPTDNLNQSGTTVYWEDIGPTNRWAMFDGEVSTQTVAPSPLTVVLKAGVVTDFYLAGVEATTVTITVRDAPDGTVIFDRTVVMEGSAPADYYEYFFDPFKPLTELLVSGADPYGNAEATITLATPGGVVKCGMLAVGSVKMFGATQYGVKVKPKSYSYIKTDEFGNRTIKRRKKSTDLTATAWLKRSDAPQVTRMIQDLLDVPAVWITPDATCFGLGSGDISYDHPQDCVLSINVQGGI